MEILGRERRRRWAQSEKLEIVGAVGVGGETLACVARRYDVSRSQIYNWRHQFRKSGLLPALAGPIFLPIDMDAPMLNAGLNAGPARDEQMTLPVMVELCLAQGRCLRFDSGIAAAVLTQLVRSVEAA